MAVSRRIFAAEIYKPSQHSIETTNQITPNMGFLSSLKDLAKDVVSEVIGNDESDKVDEDNLALQEYTEEQENTPVVMTETPKEINSLEQMGAWLISLENGASVSVQEAVKAQMQVIKFIQSPTLVDTTLDTLILSLKKSLKKASNEDEKEHLRESFSLMIQNYVFFFDARMRYTIEENKEEARQNKEEARQIFLQAGEMLSNSVKDVALMAVSGQKKAEVATVVVHNLFDVNENKSAVSLFDRIWNWWHQKEIIAEKQKIIAEKRKEFYVTLYNICKKLGKYQSLIGESMLINGMIERYTPIVYDYYAEQLWKQHRLTTWQQQLKGIENDRKEQINEIDDNIKWNSAIGVRWEWLGYIGLGALGVMVLSLIVGLFRWIVKAVAGTNVNGWFATQMYWTLGIIGIAVAIFFIIEFVHIIRCRIEANQLTKRRDKDVAEINKQFDAKRDELLQRVDAVKAELQTFVQELQQIAESYNEI